MRSVYYHLTEYCKKRNLPEPTKEDLKAAGAMIKHHFLNYWGSKQPIGMIEDCGFARMEEPSGIYVVPLYPDALADEMDGRIDFYYKTKLQKKKEPPATSIVSAPKDTSSEAKSKRKRIAKPVYSIRK